jgi:hypothetical protein
MRILVSLSLILAACGGATPASEQPSPSASKSDTAAADSAPEPETTQAEPAEASGTPSGGERPSRSPIETITAAKVAFVINYSSSEPYEKAEKRCEAKSGGDPKQRAACMQKERSDFMADVIQFKKNKKDKMIWLTYRRKGSNLTELSQAEIELSDETENTVTVKVLDTKKPRALFAARNKFKIKVPNDYSLELDEPMHGKLVYDAKIDVLAE